jgi:hypothetical protein
MQNYIIVYLGGEQPTSPGKAQQHLEKYQQWLISLGDAVVSALMPLKDTTVVNPQGEVTPGSTTAMSGFTIVQANSQDEVLEMAKKCPFLSIGGTLEVSELMQLGAPPERHH